MTASTTTITTTSMRALGFAEDSDFSLSVGSDCMVVSLRSRFRGLDVRAYALRFTRHSNGAQADLNTLVRPQQV